MSWNVMTTINLILFSWTEDFVFYQSRSFTILLSILVSYQICLCLCDQENIWPHKALHSFTSHWNWNGIQHRSEY